MSEHKINSMDYWNKRFQTNWESYLGREQTSFFVQILLGNLPEWIISEIEKEKYSICDAGCAEGDGTKLLVQRFSKSEVIGIDFSIEAVNKAKDYYPDVNFEQGDIMNLKQYSDVIICSNVLEHFSNPFEIISLLLKKATKHLIIMVPFLEYDRIKEHLYTFEYSSFPLEIKDYNLTYFKEIDGKLIDGTHWYGKQAIIVYSHKEIVTTASLNLSAINHKSEYYEREYFKQVEKIDKLINRVDKRDLDILWYRNQLDVNNQDIKSYQNQLILKDQDIRWFQKQIEEKDAILLHLTNSDREKELLIKHLISQLDENKLKLTQFEQQIDYNNQVLYNANHQLNSMQKTKGWRILNRYYKSVHSMRNLRSNTKKFIYILRTKGLNEAISRSLIYMSSKEKKPDKNNSFKLIELYSDLLNKYRNGIIKGIVFIPSAFEFDEIYNQRTINLAKYLGKEGYAVIYVAWQWEKNEFLHNSYKCFLDKIYQVPLFDFLETQFEIINEIKDKRFIITFPAKEFYNLIYAFREKAFQIIYDIMDDWEEFYNVGEAPWYSKEIEEAIVLYSDLVIGVSEPLRSKFTHLRNDIAVIGNGYDEKLSIKKNIALKTVAQDNKIHLGYFGHLTSSWFDWNLIFELAEKPEYVIHLIGYGTEDGTLKKLREYKNIKLYGKIHPSELHNYVKDWHIGLIPFKKSNLSIAVDPIKIYEYLFFGLPTISTGIPHIGSYPMVKHCEDYVSVLGAIQDLYSYIEKEQTNENDLEEFLMYSTWESRFNKMIYELENSETFRLLYEGDLS